MKKILLLGILVFIMFGCDKNNTTETVVISDWRHPAEVIAAEDAQSITPVIVVITIVDVDGDAIDEVMRVRLLSSVAPKTVENFLKLINENFHDGLTMHRIIEDFMIQGGNPELIEGRKSAKTVVGEFSANGYENDMLHTRGVISMARTNEDKNSAASQFFVVHENYSSLNTQYAAFGILADMDSYVSLDKIAVLDTDSNDAPLSVVTIRSIRVE